MSDSAVYVYLVIYDCEDRCGRTKHWAFLFAIILYTLEFNLDAEVPAFTVLFTKWKVPSENLVFSQKKIFTKKEKRIL